MLSKHIIKAFQKMYPLSNIKDDFINITLNENDYIIYNDSNNTYNISNHFSSILKYTKYIDGKFAIDNNIFISILKYNLLKNDELDNMNLYITRHNYVLQNLINRL